jgi:hypothetical protein
MPSRITIEAKTFGQRRPLRTDWSIPMPPDVEASGGRLSLRDLITRLVQAEVAAYQERQQQRQLLRLLSKEEIDASAAAGKVEMGGREAAPDADPEAAVAAALQAYEDGLYYVFVDDAQQGDLNGEVYLKPDSHVLFLRLVALAGG